MTEAREILKRIRRIEIKTRHLVEGLMQGAYYSVFRGTGIEFSEVREYHIGDDIRSIDWNVTARMNHPFVKEFVEERELTVMVFFDISASNDFGTQQMQKKDAAIEFIASMLFSAIKNNDRVGLVLATNRIEKYLPPRKGRRHALRLIREIAYSEPREKTTSLASPLASLSNIMKKRGIVFVISDFMDDLHSLRKPLMLLSKRHDVIAIKIGDIREQELPDVGYVDLEDEETGEHITINTSDPAFRERFARLAMERETQISELMKRTGVDFISIPQPDRWEIPVMRFFRERARRAA